MKKVLVFLLTLGLAANMFAIDLGNGLVLQGEVKAGVRVNSAGDDGVDDTEDTLVSYWNNDAGQPLRTRLTLTYTGDWGGAKIRFNANDGGGNFALHHAFGWANFLDKKIVVYGGNMAANDLWGLGKLSSYVFDDSIDGVTGLRVAFNVVDGLSFGFMLPTEKHGGTGGETIGHFFGGPIFGGLYKSALFSANATLRLYPAVDTKVYGANPSTETKSYVDAIVGIEVPLAPVNIIVDTRFDTRKLEDHTKVGYSRIAPLVRFTSGPLTAHARGDIIIQNEDKGTQDSDYVKYVVVKEYGDTSIAFRVGVDYKVNDTIGVYGRIGSDNVSWFAGDKDKGKPGNGLYIQPGVKFTLGSSNIEIFDKINKLGAADVVKNGKDVKPVTNQFQIDFNWSF